MKNNNGFSLAEVLVTLAVIGVIAALTIPNLLQQTNKEEHATAFKKFYSDISQAVALIEMNNGGTLSYALGNNADEMMNAFENTLIYTKKCPTGSSGCWHAGTNTWYTLDGRDGWEDRGTRPSAITNNGALISFLLSDKSCQTTSTGWGVENFCGWIVVDVNGFKGPNRVGIDIFDIYFTKDNVYPRGFAETGDRASNWDKYCNPASNDPFNGTGCGGRILSEGGIYY